MARIPYPDQTKLPAEVNELLEQGHLKIFSMWAHSVSTIELIMKLGAAQFANLVVPRAIREMVTLLGATVDSAEYEWDQHVALSKAAGVSEEQRAALRRGDVDAPCFSPAEQAALRLAAAVQAGPEVTDPIFKTARKYLSDRQLVELVGLVGYYWMLGRIATVFQVEIDVAQGTDVYDAGLRVAAHARQKS
jgi:alkylhydroperoxidase family enzyme